MGGFVIPEVNSKVTGPLVGEQLAGTVMVTDVPETDVAKPVAGVQDVPESPPSVKSIDDAGATTNPVGNVAVIVLPAPRVVAGVKATCQSEVWFA